MHSNSSFRCFWLESVTNQHSSCHGFSPAVYLPEQYSDSSLMVQPLNKQHSSTIPDCLFRRRNSLLASWLAIHQGLKGNCCAEVSGWVQKPSSISEMKQGDIIDNNKYISCNFPMFYINLFHATNEKTSLEISKWSARNMLWQPVLVGWHELEINRTFIHQSGLYAKKKT